MNLGTSTSWNPQGLSRPVIGLLFTYTSDWDTSHQDTDYRHSFFLKMVLHSPEEGARVANNDRAPVPAYFGAVEGVKL